MVAAIQHRGPPAGLGDAPPTRAIRTRFKGQIDDQAFLIYRAETCRASCFRAWESQSFSSLSK